MNYYTPVYYGSGRLARIDSVPFTGLGAAGATGSGGLGSARLVGDNEILEPGKVYTYRTTSTVAIDPERRVDIDIPVDLMMRAGWFVATVTPLTGVVVLPLRIHRAIAGQGAWDAVHQIGWRIGPPRGHASFWQSRTREAGGYRTSLNITPTAQGVKGSAARWAARRVLSFMAGSNDPNDVNRIAPGNLYERSVREDGASLLRRAAEAVVGRDTTRAATELGREVAGEAEAAILGSTAEREAREAAHKERMIFGYVGAGIAFLLGVFLATRAGSAKVERKAAAAHSVVTQGAARAAMGAAYPPSLIANSRRRRNRGEGPWRVEIRHKGSSTILSRGRFHSKVEAVKYAADQRRWDKKHGWETVTHIVKKPTIADLRRARS